MKVIFFLIMIGGFVFLVGQESEKYRWPLDIHDGYSSTFQEYRSSHFHSGVDLRTFKKTGFPVLAMADGAVVQIRVVKNDTGRGLIMRHSDGRVAVFFHLERFSDPLEQIVRSRQKQTGQKYFGDYELVRPLPVRRGELVAFSGESGVGFAHLHFEIRDPDARAINPFDLVAAPASDRLSPVIKGIRLRSRGDTLINGYIGEVYLPLEQKKDVYVLTTPFTATGPFEPVLHAYDISDAKKVVSPYLIEAELDGRPFFRLGMNAFKREQGNQLGFVYDRFFSNLGIYYFNLYRQTGFDLEKSGVDSLGLLARLEKGRHELRITIADPFGNRAMAVIPFERIAPEEWIKANPPPAPELEKAGEDSSLQDIVFDSYINNDDISIRLKYPQLEPSSLRLKVIQGGQALVLEPKTSLEGLFFHFRPLNRDQRIELRFNRSNNGMAVEEVQRILAAVLLVPGRSESFRQGEFGAEFSSQCVREPRILAVAPVELASDFPLLSAPVDLQPYRFSFLDPAIFTFQPALAVANPEQVGICKYSFFSRSWSFVRTGFNEISRMFSAKVQTGGIYSLQRDNIPPAIELGRLKSRHLKSLDQLIVRIRDQGKGVDDFSVRVWLNGKVLDVEYDPDWRTVKIDHPPYLEVGLNTLRVEVCDFAQNRSVRQFDFTLQ